MFTYSFSLKLTHAQNNLAHRMLADAMFVENWAIQARRTAYHIAGQYYSASEQMVLWAKKRKQIPGMDRWAVGMHQEAIKRVDKGYQNAFRRLKQGEKPGFPRLKTKNSFNSVTFVPRKGGAQFYPSNGERNHLRKTEHKDSTATLKIMGIGHIKVKQHQEVQGNIKTITLMRKRHKWFVSIVTDYQPKKLPKTGKKVGIDMGKRNFIATNRAEIVEAPRFLAKGLESLQLAQQKQSRSQGGTKQKREAGEVLSNTSKKRSRIVGNKHETIKNARKDFQNKLINDLIHRYDKIYVEDLNLQGMINGDAQFCEWAKRSENRNTYDAGIAMFINRLFNKAESAGKQVFFVSPAYTSQRCHKCGYICRENRNENKFHCKKCGHKDHADINAAKNILARGLGKAFKDYSPLKENKNPADSS